MSSPARGRSGKLAGALGILLALCVITAGVTPAYAVEPPPEMPHQFYGTVSRNGQPVAQGTLVEAFVGGVKQAETIVDSQGRYGYNPIFRVSGTTGATVTFKVGGVLADETATWESGKVQQLNLTIHEETPPPVQYKLTVSSTTGGSVTIPGEGVFNYYAGAVVDLSAEAAAGYGFVRWTADPPVTFADATAEQTTFTMPAQNVSVTAHFGVAYTLTMAADPVGGGNAIDVAGKGAYAAGAQVRIRAQAAAGYRFGNWTAPAGSFGNATAAETIFTMPAQTVTVTARFGVAYTLTMAVAPTGGGNATDLTNASPYLAGTVVNIKAQPAPGYAFGNWTATGGEFGNATVAETTFTMPAQNVTVTANFEAAPASMIPTVTTQAATDISSYSGSVHMSYTVGNFSSVQVRFACKRSTDPAWFYTAWVPKTTDGTYTEVLTGLVSETQYEFKAQLKYDGTVIEGDIYRFTTCKGTSTNLSDLLGSFGCFIATAAYGTPTAEQIDVLRQFRDTVLLGNAAGRLFVASYYRLSPPIANTIARNNLLRALVRELLVDPVVWAVRATGRIWRT